jgi:hypothetical protein
MWHAHPARDSRAGRPCHTGEVLAFVFYFWQSRVGKISRQQILTALSFGNLKS